MGEITAKRYVLPSASRHRNPPRPPVLSTPLELACLRSLVAVSQSVSESDGRTDADGWMNR